jgi:cytochrome c oxidase cbb3-type subunit I/II
MYYIRAIGGLFYLVGFFLMIVNLVKTAKAGSFLAEEETSAPALVKIDGHEKNEKGHRWLERNWIPFSLFVGVAILIGGVVEIIPALLIKSNVPTIASVQPYTPLELEGRDVYQKEGCYTCHSQMVRPFRSEVVRYGEYSKAGEFVYDHPYQWGSRRAGPDLAREGVMSTSYYKNSKWHYVHFMNPEKLIGKSIMPAYPWLYTKEVNPEITPKKIRAMITLGVPYPKDYDKKCVEEMNAQAKKITDELIASGAKDVNAKSEVIALIAYMQRLGTDIMKDQKTQK